MVAARPIRPIRPTRLALLTLLGLIGLIGSGLLLTGCGIRAKVESFFGGRTEVLVGTLPQDLNQQMPVAVDLVVVYDKSLLPTLLQLTAAGWFAGREQFVRDNGPKVEVHSWEWVPGQKVATQRVRYRMGLQGAVIFAGYRSTTQPHRQKVDLRRRIALQLGADTFTAGPPK